MRSIQFLNTRPSSHAAVLSHDLQSVGIAVHELSLLSIQELTPSLDDIQKLGNMQGYDVIICISPTAAKLTVAYVQAHLEDLIDNLYKKTLWIAVGSATQSILQDHGIDAVVPALKSNEGILSMPEIRQLSAKNKVLFLKGEGGRRLLINSLKDKNITTDIVNLYKRVRPKELSHAYQSLEGWGNLVLISSGESWKNWLTVCQNPHKYCYLTLGRRLETKVTDSKCMCTRVESLDTADIIKGIQSCNVSALID